MHTCEVQSPKSPAAGRAEGANANQERTDCNSARERCSKLDKQDGSGKRRKRDTLGLGRAGRRCGNCESAEKNKEMDSSVTCQPLIRGNMGGTCPSGERELECHDRDASKGKNH